MNVQALEQIEQNALTELEHKHYQQIRDAEATCDRLEDRYETDKAAAGASKKRWEEAVANLRSLIRRGPNPQQDLPFPNDWRTTPIGEAIELTEKQAELLESAGVQTIEDFENLRAGKNKDYPGGLTDLPRVGQATVDKWEEQIVEWMSKAETVAEDDPEAVEDEMDPDFDGSEDE